MGPHQADLFAPAQPLPGGLAFPDGLIYARDFITPAEETSLLAATDELPLQAAKYKAYTAKRRIVSYGSQYDFGNNELHSAPPIPVFLEPLRHQVADWLGIQSSRVAQALIAEYQPGTQLGWHRDVPNYEVIVGISLASSCRIRFRPYPLKENKREGVFALDLAPRSAYVLRDDARWRWQHSIPATKCLRYSITFRTASQAPAGQAVKRRSPKESS